MAAGLGFKDFQTGEVLTAADVDGYLMQGIWVFASAAARDAAVTSPQEGNACYLKDTNQVLTYSGSAWVAVGGGSPLTTKGDIYGFSTVDARIPIGSNDQVLTDDSTQALGLKWATPSSGGMTLISETVANANSSISFTSLGSYKQLLLIYSGIRHSTTGSEFSIRLNNSSATVYSGHSTKTNTTTLTSQGFNDVSIAFVGDSNDVTTMGISSNYSSTGGDVNGHLYIDNYTSTTKYKSFYGTVGYYQNAGGYHNSAFYDGIFKSTSAITSIDIVRLSGTATLSNDTSTTIRLYGIS